MPVPVPFVYHPEYVTPWPAGHRFPMPKFGMIAEVLRAEGLVGEGGFAEPASATRADVSRVHDRGYVDAFCEGALPDDAWRRVGLPWSEGLVRRSLRAVGGTLLTCRLALRHGLACNTAGGTHHAHRDFGSGFCIFNDIAVSLATLLDEGAIDVAMVVDLDVHQGDGTATIFADDPRVVTVSVHNATNFPLRKATSDVDVALADGVGDDAYVGVVMGGSAGVPAGVATVTGSAAWGGQRGWAWPGLAAMVEAVEPDLVVVDAGVDVHVDDRLGRLALTDGGLMRRDTAVLGTLAELGVPAAGVIGGGYDADHRRLASRHATLHRAVAGVSARLSAQTATAATPTGG